MKTELEQLDEYRNKSYNLKEFLKKEFPEVKFLWDESSKGWWTSDETFLNEYSSLRVTYNFISEIKLKRRFNSKNPPQKLIVNSDFNLIQITID